MLFLKILGALAALALGVWLGLPGRYERDSHYEDIERAMDSPEGRSKKVKRAFTPLAWVQRKMDVGSSRRNRRKQESRRGFRMENPEDR
jgi:hypothetical protein